jgi:hypothetical protein
MFEVFQHDQIVAPDGRDYWRKSDIAIAVDPPKERTGEIEGNRPQVVVFPEARNL